MSGFSLRDTFMHRDGRVVVVSTIVHDPPWSHDIPGWESTYDSETLIRAYGLGGESRLGALLKHSLAVAPGFDYPAYHEAYERADWGRVAEKHAAIVKRARRGRRRAAVMA